GAKGEGEGKLPESESSAEEFAQFFAEVAAQHKLAAVTQHNLILAVEPRLQLADTFDVDDCRPMNPGKASRIELRFESPDRLSQKIRVFADVKSDVLPFGFDPVDLVDLEEENPARCLYHEPVQAVPLRPELLKKRECLFSKTPLGTGSQPNLSPLNRLFKSRPVERLQEIIHRRHFKRAKCIAIVCGNKDHKRQRAPRNALEGLEPVHLGHLNVEKNKI